MVHERLDPRRGREAGFSLMEVIVATVIATVAVLGLAYTFGMGRAYINRFATARAALAEAQARLETLAVLPPGSASLTLGTHAADFTIDGALLGKTLWRVTGYDDPADGMGAADSKPVDLKRVVVVVSWQSGALTDSVRLERLYPAAL